MSSKRIETKSPAETADLGLRLGQALKGGEFIELIGDVGAGKTTLVKGIALGAGSEDLVTSPTFVLANSYNGRIKLNHLDLYRLNDAGLLKNEVAEALGDKSSATIVEWGGGLHGVLPEDRVKIEIKATGEESRLITVQAPPKLERIKKAIE